MNTKTTLFPLFAALLAIIGGGVVLLGWAFDNDSLKGILPFWSPMKANAAVCFILLGGAIILSDFIHGSRTALYSGQACAMLAGLISLLTLIEYALHTNLGIDELLFHDPIDNGIIPANPVIQQLEVAFPGRIKLEAAVCILLLAIASIHSDKNHWRILSASCGVIIFSLAMASLSSVLTPELGQFGWFGYGVMRMNAAVLFALLGAAIIALNWQRNISSWAFHQFTTLAFIAGIFLLVLIGFNSSRAQFWLQSNHYEIAFNENREAELNSLLVFVTKAQTNTRGYVITGEESFLKQFLSAKADSLTELEKLKQIEPSHYFSQLNVMVNKQLQWYQQVIDSRENGNNSMNNMIANGTTLLDNLNQRTLHIKNEHNRRVIQLKQESEGVTEFSYFIISSGTLFSIIIALIAIFRFNFMECQRKHMEEALKNSEERFRTLFEQAPLGIALIDSLTGHIYQANEEYAHIVGLTVEELQHIDWMQITHPDDMQTELDNMGLMNAGKTNGFVMEKRYIRPDGAMVWINLTVANIGFKEQCNPCHHCIVEDIRDRKAAEEEIKQLAFYDPLTGLPNRRKLVDRLQYTIAMNHRENSQFAVFMLDLDKFKAVNDSLGHAAGDELLKQVAARITNCLRDSDMVARLGGDEFVLVLENLKVPEDAEIIALKVIADLSVPFQLSEHDSVKIGASIGISIYPQHGSTPEKLMDHADTALYQAKDNGRGCFAYFLNVSLN